MKRIYIALFSCLYLGLSLPAFADDGLPTGDEFCDAMINKAFQWRLSDISQSETEQRLMQTVSNELYHGDDLKKIIRTYIGNVYKVKVYPKPSFGIGDQNLKVFENIMKTQKSPCAKAVDTWIDKEMATARKEEEAEQQRLLEQQRAYEASLKKRADISVQCSAVDCSNLKVSGIDNHNIVTANAYMNSGSILISTDSFSSNVAGRYSYSIDIKKSRIMEDTQYYQCTGSFNWSAKYNSATIIIDPDCNARFDFYR